MADTTKTPASLPAGSDDLDQMAFQLYCERIAAHPYQRGGEQIAIEAYKKAEVFLAVRRKFKAGELKQQAEKSSLADCFAPNLRRTHPINLVSQKFGSLERTRRIGKWLAENPTPEREPEELVNRLNQEFSDLGWDLPTINVARAVFASHLKN